MELRHLTALVAVADHRSFSGAARALHTVQSNISTHVARLERELEVTLVERGTVSLTPEGEAVVNRARRVQGELEAMIADLAALRDVVTGSVRIGVIGTAARWLTTELLEATKATYPQVHVVVVDATTTSLVPQLLSDRLDLALVNLPVVDPELTVEALFEEERVVVVPTGHPLADREEVSLPELAEHELLLEPPGTGFRDELDVAAAEAGVTLSSQADVDGMRLLADLAFEGYGAAVLPASAVRAEASDSWATVRVTGLLPRSVGLAQRRRGLLSAPARAVRQLMRETIARFTPKLSGIHCLVDPIPPQT